jgi:aldose 1-epimerase
MIEPFGTTRAGAEVAAVGLAAGRLRARILTLGAILQDLRLDGRPLALGAPELAAYDDGPMRHFGAVIGPPAGRLRDGRGRLGGDTLALDVGAVPHALHGGAHGLHARIWEVMERSETRVALVAIAAPGAGGFPGARRFGAAYSLAPEGLRLVLTAETDAPTWVNLTHHGYWHMGGPPGVDRQRLRIEADRVLPIDAETLPTGEVRPVAGSRFDFRAPREIGPDRIDNCFCLAEGERTLTEVASLAGPDGTALGLATTAPGLQVFTGDGAATPGHAGNHGAPYPSRPGLALEPQGWPDAPNHPAFPSIRLDPGATWRREILWRIAPGG